MGYRTCIPSAPQFAASRLVHHCQTIASFDLVASTPTLPLEEIEMDGDHSKKVENRMVRRCLNLSGLYRHTDC
jgi:hypothetical protein